MTSIDLKPMSGTYALLLRSTAIKKTAIGQWGVLQTIPGYYLYVGSAFGPGGIRARVSRHCRIKKSKHWHIDYLRELTEPVSVLYSYNKKHLEHLWAQSITALKEAEPVKGFGCSDCTCDSHLFVFRKKITTEQFMHAVDMPVASWVYHSEYH